MSTTGPVVAMSPGARPGCRAVFPRRRALAGVEPGPVRIGVWLDAGDPGSAEVARGIRCCPAAASWRIAEILVQPGGDRAIPEAVQGAIIVRAGGDLQVCLPTWPADATHLPRSPIVNVRVASDEAAVGMQALAHLRSRGYRALACCVDPQRPATCERRAAFRAASAQAGLPVCDLLPEAEALATIRRQVRERPLGIFAASGAAARVLLAHLIAAGIAIPQQVGLICGDDDAPANRLAAPSLSGIGADAGGLGAAAAMALSDLLAGRPHAPLVRVAPLAIYARRSSETGVRRRLRRPHPALAAAAHG